MNGIEVDRLAWTLIHFVWEGALIAALYAMARQCVARRAGPNLRYLLALGALLMMSVAPLLTWIELGAVATTAAAQAASPPVITSLPPATPVALAGLPASAVVARLNLPSPALLAWIAALWCAGALLCWMRLTIGWLLAARLGATCVSPAPGEWQARFTRLQARLRVSQPARLLVSARVTAPVVVGWLRPVVLAPACAFTGLASDQLEAVLLHELAHIRRHDYPIHLWQSAVEALLFYHPAVWWVSGHMRAEREFCCDDMAVAASGDALSYARALTELEAARPRQPELAMAASGGPLLRRITRLLDRTPPPPAGFADVGMLAMLVLLSAAAFALGDPNGISRIGGTQSGAATQSTLALLPAFDVVSVKPFVFPNRPWHRQAQYDPQRLYIEGMAPVELIELAYSLNSNQLTGLPEWANYSRDSLFSIAATTDKPTSKDQMLLMLRRVLADRFQLRVEENDKIVPVWALVVPPTGPKFKTIGPDESCLSGAISSDDMKKAGAPPNSIGSFHGCSMADLVHAFNGGPNPQELGRPVVDRTGLTGRYDLTIWQEFVRDDSYTGPGFRMSYREPFREAVQKELGLTLMEATSPYRVVNVVSIARPAPDK